MAATRRKLEDDMACYSQALHERGWVANHDGNLSARLGEGRILATPTSVSKKSIGRRELIVVDSKGKLLSGRGKPFSELVLHLFVLRERPDVEAVIHSHAPQATALAIAGQAVQTTFMPEAVVSLGDSVPLIPYAPPKSVESTTYIRPFVQAVDAVTMENHGVLTWGPDLETAYLRMELVEHLAHMQILALQAGKLQTIPDADVKKLLAARTNAGLGLEGRQKAAADVGTTVRSPVESMVREEVARAVRRR